MPEPSKIDQPIIYQITIEGWLDSSWADWFDNMVISITKDQTGAALTTLTGPVADQSTLHGVLTRLSALGLTLLDVHRLGSGE